MTHSQLLEVDTLLGLVAEAQGRIAGAMERLDNAGGDEGAALEVLDQCIEGIEAVNSAVGQSGHDGLATVSRSLAEHLASRRDGKQALIPEEILHLFDWTVAVGAYLENPATEELADTLLAPLPDELKVVGWDALAAGGGVDSNGQQITAGEPAGGAAEMVTEGEEGIGRFGEENPDPADPGVIAFPEEDGSDLPDSLPETLDSASDGLTEEFDISLFAPENEESGDDEESILGVLLDELSQIAPQLASHAAMMAAADEAGAEQAATSYLELVSRLLTASDSLGLEGLTQIAEFIGRNIGLAMEGGRQLRETAQPLFAGWPEVVQTHLKDPRADEPCLAVVDYLEQEAWPEPLTYKDARALLEGLTRELVVSGDYEVEARATIATAEDLSLEIEQDANQHLVDAFLVEAPGHAEELSRLTGEVAAGNRVAENTQALQRIAHTLKGSANLIALKGVANMAHHLEDIFEYLAKKGTAPPSALGQCLQVAADTIEAMLDTFQGLAPAPANAQQVLQEILDWANRIDRGLRDADLAPADAEVAPAIAEPSEQPSPAGGALDLLRVPRNTIDSIFKMVGESSIALGQIQERLKRLSAGNIATRGQELILQQRRFELENLVSVRGMASRQRRMGTLRQKFDPLEMDEYDEFYGATHAFIEAVSDSREASRQMANELMQLEALYLQQQRLNRELQGVVMTTRMVAVKTIAARLQRAVRQACRATGNKAELRIDGETLMLDGDVLNKLVDPLMHILRNAVDHGIESPNERIAAGKSGTGRVDLAFSQEGNNITVRCADDGCGLDYQRIKEKAVAKGLLGASEEPGNSMLARLLMRPGFTTRDQATQVSGRGVGMDVVNTAVINLKGSIDITDNTPSGTMITMRIPITLLTSHSLLVRAGEEHFAIPTATLEQVLSLDAGQFQKMGSNVTYRLGEAFYPARSLPDLLGLATDQDLLLGSKTSTLLVRVDNETYAVAVSQVVASHDLVIKSLGRYVGNLQGISGVSILGDGGVVPVLDLVDLLRADTAKTMPGRQRRPAKEQFERVSLPQVLIVDDSLSVRKSLSQLVQDAGLQPLVARDGVEALEVMREQKPDLVLTDLEMPRMTGLELSAHIRASEATRDLPVIMVTSRTMQKHRDEAKRSGVDRYVTKPFAEDDLMGNIQAMLAG